MGGRFFFFFPFQTRYFSNHRKVCESHLSSLLRLFFSLNVFWTFKKMFTWHWEFGFLVSLRRDSTPAARWDGFTLFIVILLHHPDHTLNTFVKSKG